MDILKRIRSCLKNIEGREPWPYGFDAEKAGPKAKSVWATLTVEERLAASCKNPFKAEREEFLRGLYQKGLTQAVLSQISGLSHRSIEKITAEKKKHEQDQ